MHLPLSFALMACPLAVAVLNRGDKREFVETLGAIWNERRSKRRVCRRGFLSHSEKAELSWLFLNPFSLSVHSYSVLIYI